jgi:GT2 family glycosyltransferase
MLSLIICTYKRPQLLKTVISCAIKVVEKINSEIIIINDDSTTPIDVPIHPKIRMLNNPKKGLGSARNHGGRHAEGDVLLFIDDDIEFSVEVVQKLLAVYNTHPACYNPNWEYSVEMMNTLKKKSFGRFLIKHELINYKGWVPDIPWNTNMFETHKLAGFFLMMPKLVFTELGGFNENFINQGTEDDEFSFRIKTAGYKLYVDPKVYVNHNELDRISLESRLKRYFNGAINRRKAFEMGHKSYEIPYSATKKILLTLTLPFYHFIIQLTKLIPNKNSFDWLYFRFCHLLLALSIFKGYSHKEY